MQSCNLRVRIECKYQTESKRSKGKKPMRKKKVKMKIRMKGRNSTQDKNRREARSIKNEKKLEKKEHHGALIKADMLNKIQFVGNFFCFCFV